MAENSQSNDTPATPANAGVAADMIRDKVLRLYADEPAAGQELAEAEAVRHRSKHQQFMHQLSNSGQDLAAIQTAWHNYYQSLPAVEQHQVWQEFYESQSVVTGQPSPQASDPQT